MISALERIGSSKDVHNIFDERGQVFDVRFGFSDRVSILDLGPIPNTLFSGLGKVRCAISGFIFQQMHEATPGFKTHYISHDVEAATMDVHPLDITELDVSYGEASIGRILGVEIIHRRMVTEKLIDRVASGRLATDRINFFLEDRDLVPNARFSPPFVECTTKYRDADQYISDCKAVQLGGMSDFEWLQSQCYSEVRRASDFLSDLFRRSGFDCHDGKFEGAVSYKDGSFIFADSISPDEMRIIGPDGRSYDKDPVRQWYEKTFPDWYQSVLAAKKADPDDKSMWPTYPEHTLPKEVIEDVVDRYATVAEAIGAI